MGNTRVSFRVTGLDEYLEKIQKIGANLDEIVSDALTESAKPIYNDIKTWLEKHNKTNTALGGLDQSKVKRDGFQYYVEVGVNGEKSPGAWHIAFVEYGTPRANADPGIRPAFKKNQAKVKRIQVDILQKAGVPID